MYLNEQCFTLKKFSARRGIILHFIQLGILLIKIFTNTCETNLMKLRITIVLKKA